MGQAKRRGTPEDRSAIAIAWDEARQEDRERFPPPSRRRDRGAGWLVLVAALATVCNPNPSR